MNKKTFGIDIGSAYLKAVALSRDFKGRPNVTASAVIELAAAGGPEQALRTLFSDRRFQGGKSVFSIPAGSCSFRNLTLPFSDERSIDDIITYELEPHIPDPIETVRVDALPPRSIGGATTVLAAAARKEDLERLSQAAAVGGIAMIDTDAVPIAQQILEENSPDAAWLLLDIGACVSVAVFVQDSAIVHVRSFPWGSGKPIGQSAALQDFPPGNGISLQQPGAEDQGGPVEADNLSLRFQDLTDTLHLLTVQGLLKDPPSRVYLTGGGALRRTLREDLEASLQLPVEMVDLLKGKGVSLPAKHRLAWNAPLMNQALALALRAGNGSGAGFDFYRGESESRKKTAGLKGHLRWTALMAAIVLLCLGANLAAGYYADRRKLNFLKEEISKTFKESCPEVTRIVDPVRQLQQKIEETRKFSGGIEDSPLFLDSWKKATDALPENSGIVVRELVYNPSALEISGETADFRAINAWKSALEKSRSFSDVEIHFGNSASREAKKTFKLRMTHAL